MTVSTKFQFLSTQDYFSSSKTNKRYTKVEDKEQKQTSLTNETVSKDIIAFTDSLIIDNINDQKRDESRSLMLQDKRHFKVMASSLF